MADKSKGAETELTEEELEEAIAATETEIFDEASGEESAEDDGDKGLERMEGVDGEPLDDDGEPIEEEEGEELRAGEDKGEDDETEPEGEGDDKSQARVPSHRLREEREKRTAAEQRENQLREQLARLSGQVETLTRVAVKPQDKQEPKTKPDMFSDPEGYEKALREEIKAELAGELRKPEERFVNYSMSRAHREHGEAFETAYGALSKLDPRDPQNVATVQSILSAPDPGTAVLEWHEKQQMLADPAAYRESLKAEILAELRSGARGGAGKGAVRRSPPSLNGASGAGSHRGRVDPRSVDGSEGAIFNYVFDPSAG